MVDQVSDKIGVRLKFLIGKPGLDGHSNGAEQIAALSRDCGIDVDYAGIRLTPEEIVEAARDGAHVIGLSILSGSHLSLVKACKEKLDNEGLGHIPIVVGGIIPQDDQKVLKDLGVEHLYTPKDFKLNSIMKDMIELAGTRT